MNATTPSTTDHELDLDVRFVDSGLELAGGDSDDCTDDECPDTITWPSRRTLRSGRRRD